MLLKNVLKIVVISSLMLSVSGCGDFTVKVNVDAPKEDIEVISKGYVDAPKEGIDTSKEDIEVISKGYVVPKLDSEVATPANEDVDIPKWDEIPKADVTFSNFYSSPKISLTFGPMIISLENNERSWGEGILERFLLPNRDDWISVSVMGADGKYLFPNDVRNGDEYTINVHTYYNEERALNGNRKVTVDGSKVQIVMTLDSMFGKKAIILEKPSNGVSSVSQGKSFIPWRTVSNEQKVDITQSLPLSITTDNLSVQTLNGEVFYVDNTYLNLLNMHRDGTPIPLREEVVFDLYWNRIIGLWAS